MKITFTLKRLFLLSLLFSSAIASTAQLEVTPRMLDLGELLLYTTKQATVTLTNRGQQSITVTEAATSASCLSVDGPMPTIAPGGSAEVKVSFNAQLVGHFDKAIYFHTNDTADVAILHLSGSVVMQPSVAKDSSAFPYHVGKIWLSSDNLEFDEVGRGDTPVQTLQVYNAGTTVYRPELMHLPSYLSVEAVPKRLFPGRAGQLRVTLNSKAITDMGLTQTAVYLSRYPGDKVGEDNEVTIDIVLVPAFDSLSVVQRELAPHLDISTTRLNLPAFNGKSKVKGVVELRNTGKSSLKISALQVFNPAVGADLSSVKIAPGHKAKLKITVQQAFLKRTRGRLRVLMITNDPAHHKLILNIQVGNK
ncbi:MAG: DUF1573 domain-containing protein [Prevotellaceae bacterium]|nr:DUF1573 domain-containing protein [Prevotellaceae bacterium]MDY3856907.1 DUF1573 domain-containing protein [Bacteroidaceae bacterium]